MLTGLALFFKACALWQESRDISAKRQYYERSTMSVSLCERRGVLDRALDDAVGSSSAGLSLLKVMLTLGSVHFFLSGTECFQCSCMDPPMTNKVPWRRGMLWPLVTTGR